MSDLEELKDLMKAGPDEEGKSGRPRICYDCRWVTGEYVLERRQTGGGDGKIYPKDFLDVAVCRDRVACGKRRAGRRGQQ